MATWWKVTGWLLVVMLLLMALPGTVAAQGPIVQPPDDIPAPPPTQRGIALDLLSERIEVRIEGQVATTRVAQTFLNPSSWALEGEYLFPLPPDAAISDMDMTVNGERLEGQLMTAEQARAIYEEIVRRRMDPALLEWVGGGLFRTHIFPIPPGETRLIELEYSQLLTPEAALFEYRFPLRQANDPDGRADVSLTIEVTGEAPLRAIYSPSHEVDVIREGERGAIVGWEGRNQPLNEDFSLFWSVSPDQIEVNLLSYQARGEDGFFMLLASPPIEPPQEAIVARDVVLVMDVSGSMEGEKMAQARDSLDWVLDHLNPADRFNVIAFSTGTRPFATRLQPMSEVAAARRWVAELEPGGSTDISRALLEALALGQGSDRPMMVIFVTDGLPTAGIIERDRILAAAQVSAPEDVRLFTFGVGYDVDTLLLDTLAAEMGGAAGYITPDERIDEEISAFYTKVSAPVLADVQLQWEGATVEELYPSPLPELFAGQQLVVAGRYRAGGPVTLVLTGEVNGEPQRYRYDDLRLETGTSDATWLPRLWATRKIGTLLQSIRRHGPSEEAIEEVIELGLRYGIVTPYTTFLVDEGEELRPPVPMPLPQEEGFNRMPQAVAPPSGADAVAEAEAAEELATSDMAPLPTVLIEGDGSGEMAAPALRVVGSKTFVQRGEGWVDTQWRDELPERTLPFGSTGYFELAGRSPEVAQWLSVGVPLRLVVEGEAFHIVEADGPLPTVTEVALPSPTAAIEAEAAPTTIAVAPLASDERAAPEPGEGTTNLPLLPLGVGALLVAAGIALWRRRA